MFEAPYLDLPARFLVFSLLTIVFVMTAVVFAPPRSLPAETLLIVEDGVTLSDISVQLKKEGVIRSPLTLILLVKLLGGERSIQTGGYFFGDPASPINIAHRLTHGDFGIEPVRITIFEGTSSREMAVLLEEQLVGFDKEDFLNRTEDLEGYLFPDTYFFLPGTSSRQIVKDMRDNFDMQIATIQEEIDAQDIPLEELLVMASLIEKEAYKQKDRQLISGVLWNRIEIDMALQVDAVFEYIIDKNTYEVTLEDLKVESPYNTYQNKGLPPGPITNPGLNAIKAALNPTPNDYLFYLADREGNTYYSETFEGHKVNKARHIR